MNKDMFVRFLKSRGIYYRVIELLNNKGIGLDEFVDNNSISSLIDRTCMWSSTFEGRAFWSNKNDEWKAICYSGEPDFLMRCNSIW